MVDKCREEFCCSGLWNAPLHTSRKFIMLGSFDASCCSVVVRLVSSQATFERLEDRQVIKTT